MEKNKHQQHLEPKAYINLLAVCMYLILGILFIGSISSTRLRFAKGFGILLLFYGLFRAYRFFKDYFSENIENDDE